jgi:RNA polymerase-interacting CarD/CdnL/TRCF family regulator
MRSSLACVGQPSELASVREEIKKKEDERRDCMAKFDTATTEDKQFYADARKELAAELAILLAQRGKLLGTSPP